MGKEKRYSSISAGRFDCDHITPNLSQRLQLEDLLIRSWESEACSKHECTHWIIETRDFNASSEIPQNNISIMTCQKQKLGPSH